MSRLFWPYFVVYAVLCFFGLQLAIEENEPMLQTGFDFVVVAVTIAGMLIYRLKQDWRAVSAAWRAVFFFLLIGTVASLAYDIVQMARDPKESFFSIVLVIFFTILIELPAFIMNGRVAFTPAPATLRAPQARRA